MEYTDREYCLEVWGDWACFTRPELKVERVSYDVITPSAARAIFEAIFWKPAIRWQVTRIEVINPIKWTTIRRNEVGAVASASALKSIFIDDGKSRQQKNSLLLQDVRYRIYAKLIYRPARERKGEEIKEGENPMKYYQMFERRASQGQCFTQPYLGCREFAACWQLVDVNNLIDAPLAEDRDLGIMLYDMDFEGNPKRPDAMFYRAKMEQGVIVVPEKDSEEVLR